MCLGPRSGWGRCTCSVQGSSRADGLELVGDDDRLVGFAGALAVAAAGRADRHAGRGCRLGAATDATIGYRRGHTRHPREKSRLDRVLALV